MMILKCILIFVLHLNAFNNKNLNSIIKNSKEKLLSISKAYATKTFKEKQSTCDLNGEVSTLIDEMIAKDIIAIDAIFNESAGLYADVLETNINLLKDELNTIVSSANSELETGIRQILIDNLPPETAFKLNDAIKKSIGKNSEKKKALVKNEVKKDEEGNKIIVSDEIKKNNEPTMAKEMIKSINNDLKAENINIKTVQDIIPLLKELIDQVTADENAAVESAVASTNLNIQNQTVPLITQTKTKIDAALNAEADETFIKIEEAIKKHYENPKCEIIV